MYIYSMLESNVTIVGRAYVDSRYANGSYEFTTIHVRIDILVMQTVVSRHL